MAQGQSDLVFDTVEEAIQAIKEGKMIMVLDDQDRENEGDLIVASEFATPEVINFMATHAKGLICQPISEAIAKRLNLHPMVSDNTDNHETAFTVAIDHVDTTTGISAYERSLTIQAVVDDEAVASDFRRPGHVFPLIAKAGGVLERNGHTEATVDLARLAGLKESGVCVEIMADDGHMMRGSELIQKAKEWDMPVINIQQLQHYRKVHDQLVKETSVVKMPTIYGQFSAHTFVNLLTGEHHIALVKGNPKQWSHPSDILTRIHSECLTGDAFGSMRCDCGEQFESAMKAIEAEGEGIMLYMRQEGRGIGLVNKLKAYALQDQGLDTVEANLALGFEEDQREYDIAAQILKNLKVEGIRLLTNNPDKIDQLASYGMEVVERVPIQMPANDFDSHYLETKRERMGHLLDK